MLIRRAFRPLALLLFLLAFAPPGLAGTLKIVAGTSLIEDIALDLTGGRAEVLTLIKGSSCPGHEGARTGDFVFAAGADLVLVHAFQENLPQLTGMLEAVKNKNIRLVALGPQGSWLVPATQRRAVLELARVLAEADPAEARAIGERAEKRLARLDAAEKESLARLAPIRGKEVVAAEMQAEFADWAGLRVVRTYKRAEELNPRDLARLVDALRGRVPAGVIDNYQSGPEAGLPLALELRAAHLTLSNFPGSSAETPDYFSLLRHNVEQLIKLGG